MIEYSVVLNEDDFPLLIGNDFESVCAVYKSLIDKHISCSIYVSTYNFDKNGDFQVYRKKYC